MTDQVRQCLEHEKADFEAKHGREMTSADVPFEFWWRKGEIAADEPPGLSERYYQLWLYLGGKVDRPKPVTADDL